MCYKTIKLTYLLTSQLVDEKGWRTEGPVSDALVGVGKASRILDLLTEWFCISITLKIQGGNGHSGATEKWLLHW